MLIYIRPKIKRYQRNHRTPNTSSEGVGGGDGSGGSSSGGGGVKTPSYAQCFVGVVRESLSNVYEPSGL
jgi:hypothetical protein